MICGHMNKTTLSIKWHMWGFKMEKQPLMCGKFGHCKAKNVCPIKDLLTEQAGIIYTVVLPTGEPCPVFYKED